MNYLPELIGDTGFSAISGFELMPAERKFGFSLNRSDAKARIYARHAGQSGQPGLVNPSEVGHVGDDHAYQVVKLTWHQITLHNLRNVAHSILESGQLALHFAVQPDLHEHIAGQPCLIVKEPQLHECAMLRPGQVLFTYLHLAPDPAQTEALLTSSATAIAYETVTADDGSLPLLTPMSEMAGRLSIQATWSITWCTTASRIFRVPYPVPVRSH